MTEVRTISSTGGEKGVKSARVDLLPANVLLMDAEHYAKGAEKYEDNNWRLGYEWSKAYAAAMRHMLAFWDGEDIDPETGSRHVVSARFHMASIADWMDSHPEFDDRYSTVVARAEAAKKKVPVLPTISKADFHEERRKERLEQEQS